MKNCSCFCPTMENFICCLYCVLKTDYCGRKCSYFEKFFKEENFTCPDEEI